MLLISGEAQGTAEGGELSVKDPRLETERHGNPGQMGKGWKECN